VGLRTKSFLKVKVYAIGLYVADSALAGSLKDKTGPALYQELVWGDFPKEIHLRLVRDVSASQMQEAIRDALEKADKARTDEFVAYFGDIKTGEEYVLRWAPGGTLETLAKGTPKPPIADKNFAAAVFGIWLGDEPVRTTSSATSRVPPAVEVAASWSCSPRIGRHPGPAEAGADEVGLRDRVRGGRRRGLARARARRLAAPRAPGLDDAGAGRPESASACARPREPRVYIILLTGKDEREDVVRGLTAGADDYLRKPFDNVELEARMRTGRRIVELEDELVKVRAALHEHQAREQAHGRVVVPHSERTPGRGGPAKR
jgi:CheY-like chemotaxis protein